MYTGAALSFGLIRACRSGLVLYCSVLSDAGGDNDGSSAIFERSQLGQIFPLRENTLRHVVEGHGRYPRAMTPSVVWIFKTVCVLIVYYLCDVFLTCMILLCVYFAMYWVKDD